MENDGGSSATRKQRSFYDKESSDDGKEIHRIKKRERKKQLCSTFEVFQRLERKLGVCFKLNEDGKRRCVSRRCLTKPAIFIDRFLVFVDRKRAHTWRDHRFCDDCRNHYNLESWIHKEENHRRKHEEQRMKDIFTFISE
jgi:hypothetical protein